MHTFIFFVKGNFFSEAMNPNDLVKEIKTQRNSMDARAKSSVKKF